MSTMLEQAIVDAEALREAALKSAEATVIEKYSEQIKEAVEQLLEQPEMEDDLLATAQDEEGGEDISAVTDQIPLGSVSGEKACPCPEDSETIELNLDQLERAVNDAMEPAPPPGGAEASAFALEENIMLALESANIELESDEEELELDMEVVEELAEQLDVDVANHSKKSGWAGTAARQYEIAEEELLAMEQDSIAREERAAMKKAIKELEALKEGLQNKLSERDAQADKLFEAVNFLKESFDKVNLSNARLLYTNKALTSDSLNERQKNKLVEAINKAENVDEAKVIYETLQSAVGSSNKPKQPKSLSEAIKKSSTSTILMSRYNHEKKIKDPSIDRWKRLAGLDKN
jgi:hypothetical protein